MADTSQYLAQALQQMQSAPPITTPQPDLVALQRQMQARRTFEQANPGKSYFQHNLDQMGQQIGGGPLGKLAGMFGLGGAQGGAMGQGMSGLQSLAAQSQLNPADLLAQTPMTFPGGG